MSAKKSRRSRGFSLLEMLVSMAILLVVAGTAFGAMNGFANIYGSTMMKADMDSGIRSAAESMTQEIGQAGALPYNVLTLSSAVTASASAQTVTVVGSTVNLFVGQNLLVDAGLAQEDVTITAVPSASSITTIFKNSHPAATMLDGSGVFAEGILHTSTPTQLQLMGDLNGDGTIVYVEYNCNPNATGTGTLTRSITTLPATVENPPTVLLQNLITNPVLGNACFTYPALTTMTVSAKTYNFFTSVGLSLTVQSPNKDPQTGQYQTLSKSFMNISPRNVLAGLDMATTGQTNKLNLNPPNVPL